MADPQLHPTLTVRIDRVLAAMRALGFPMHIVQKVRTTEQQQALYAQGRTKPGPLVTNCDGVIKRSNHQIALDSYGHAVDCAFDTADPFNESWPWKAYGALVEAVGLKWGGGAAFLKAGINDRPHAELP